MKIIRNYKELKQFRLKNKNKKIGLCHGAFDIFHIGHLKHLKEAKEHCDILVVSITSSKYISKNPSLPYYNDRSRIEIIENLEIVDRVFLDISPSALLVLDALKPNIYFKGADYKKRKNDFVGNLKKEISILKKNNIKFHTTITPLQSSSNIFLNNYSDLNKMQLKFVKKIKSKFLFVYILEKINELKKLDVNILGETIIDKYKFVKILGIASKFPIYSGVQKSEESYPGGTLATANVAAEFAKKVNLITGIDKKVVSKKFYNKKNINLKNIPKLNHQTKTRYLNEYRNERFFQLSNFAQIDIEKNSSFIINELKKFKPLSTNLIFDYGIWQNTNSVNNFINKKKVNYSLNVQANSLNLGKNLIDKFKNYKICSLDYKEYCVNLGISTQDFKYENFNTFVKIKKNFYKKFKKNNSIIIVTLGKDGSIVFNKKFLFHCPVFISSAIDTTGCGDVFFLIFSLLVKNNTPIELSQFLATIYSGLHSLFLGNKKVVDKFEFIKFINFLYKL